MNTRCLRSWLLWMMFASSILSKFSQEARGPTSLHISSFRGLNPQQLWSRRLWIWRNSSDLSTFMVLDHTQLKKIHFCWLFFFLLCRIHNCFINVEKRFRNENIKHPQSVGLWSASLAQVQTVGIQLQLTALWLNNIITEGIFFLSLTGSTSCCTTPAASTGNKNSKLDYNLYPFKH